MKVIFNKNPTEIGSIYSGQEEIYSKHLLELNKRCFEEKDVYIFREVLGKNLKLFQGGNDALISFLVNILTIINYAIDNDYKIRISSYNAGIDFLMAKKQYLGSVEK